MAPSSAPEESTAPEQTRYSTTAEAAASTHSSGDIVLGVLSTDDGLLGDLVRAFPGGGVTGCVATVVRGLV